MVGFLIGCLLSVVVGWVNLVIFSWLFCVGCVVGFGSW